MVGLEMGRHEAVWVGREERSWVATQSGTDAGMAVGCVGSPMDISIIRKFGIWVRFTVGT